ncbi:MAG: tRNA pseudouridine(38-40) synthase TruA [Lachnospiraceae bacterium]|nr:tRNA pseudouridine(38-40) synthase TruA [Lachnospiraceae bacterium]
MTQKNYKMTIEYDGSRYKGWQSQKSTDVTVQGKLNAVFSALEGCAVQVQGSGRTDAGVHAAGQTANVRLTVDLTVREIKEYVNQYLPEDIGILEIEEVSEKFHARLSAVKKTYCYRIFNSSDPNVFERKWMHRMEKPLDLAAMRRGAQYFIGTHDFAGFCSRASKKKSTVRTIYRADVLQKGREVDIVVCGDGFLHHMVRIIAGTLVEIGLGRRAPLEIEKILQEGVRKEAGITMPAKGLILCSVEYKEGI